MGVHNLQALLFDVDGTLADTERDGHRVAFNLAFRDAGLDWEWDAALYGELLAVTGGKERIRFYLEKYNQDFEAPADLDEFIAGLHQAKTDHYTRLLSEGRIPLRPGVERLLREARKAGLRLAITTTTTPANVEALLVHTVGAESLDWFEVIAAGDIVPAKKPAPDIYFYALEEMELDPSDCLAFEDSINGIRATHGANLKTIITVNDYTRDDDFSDAALVLDTFGEPDAPCHVLAGDAKTLNGSTCLDVATLRRLHEDA
ncbi:MAG: HAD family hydrolase [Gammaproteobacteria bacterium]|nr:HAD family hydrolase [Gammaproteobacteria bacterium]